MTTAVLLILIAFVLVASASLLHALNHAVEGYEDESGFHQGTTKTSGSGLPVPVAVRADWVSETSEHALPHRIPGKPIGAF